MKLHSAALAAMLVTGCAAHHPGGAPAAPAATISEISVRSHMEFLASDALAGRGSGTRDEWIAATYIAAQMRRFGLEPAGDEGGFVQTIAIERTEAAAPPILSFAGGRFTHGEQILVPSMRAARLSGPLHKVGAAGSDVPAGAVALMPADASAGASERARGAILQLSRETPQVRSRWSAAAAGLPPLPPQLRAISPQAPRPTTIYLDAAAYDTLASLPEGTPVTLSVDVKPPQTTHTWNAVGRLTGSDATRRSEVILLSAHLDHVGTRTPPRPTASGDDIYNGADDDASGTVAVLELAEALARGPKPERTMVFALFGSEESGGLGSLYFAERPPAPLTAIVANLQFEMIGRPDAAVPAQTLWLTGYERSTLGPALAKHGARLVRDPHPEQNFFMRSDNYQFARRGIVAHTVSSYGMHRDYHQPSDELRTIDFTHMTRAIRSLLEPIRWLANSSFTPEWLPGRKP